MKYTDKLGLPIWNEPETDVFDIQDFNKGNQAIDDEVEKISSQLDTKVNNKELLSSFLKMDNVIITDEYDELTETSYTKTIIPYKIDDNIRYFLHSS